MVVSVDEDFVRARVDFELALKSVQGNHTSLDKLSFRKVQLLRSPDWVPQMIAALIANTVVTELDLSQTGLTDVALQHLAAALAVPSRCPKLRRLNLSGNASLSKMGETVARGLCKLRAGLELTLDEGLDAQAEGFVHDKQLVAGLTAWNTEDLKISGASMQDFYCPEDVVKAVGEAAVAEARAEAGTPDGERLRLTRGFQGPNGTKYKTTFATFEHFHSTGNIVLMTLQGASKSDAEGVVV